MTKSKDDRATLRTMSEGELVKELNKERQALVDDQMQRVFGKLKNHRTIRLRRHRIARLATILTDTIAKTVSHKEK